MAWPCRKSWFSCPQRPLSASWPTPRPRTSVCRRQRARPLSWRSWRERIIRRVLCGGTKNDFYAEDKYSEGWARRKNVGRGASTLRSRSRAMGLQRGAQHGNPRGAKLLARGDTFVAMWPSCAPGAQLGHMATKVRGVWPRGTPHAPKPKTMVANGVLPQSPQNYDSQRGPSPSPKWSPKL